jgi:hypothetical protein
MSYCILGSSFEGEKMFQNLYSWKYAKLVYFINTKREGGGESLPSVRQFAVGVLGTSWCQTHVKNVWLLSDSKVNFSISLVDVNLHTVMETKQWRRKMNVKKTARKRRRQDNILARVVALISVAFGLGSQLEYWRIGSFSFKISWWCTKAEM